MKEERKYRTQQILIGSDSKLIPLLELICRESNKLTNCAIYHARQLFFETGEIIGKFSLDSELKNNEHYKMMYSQAAQQTLLIVEESFKSYKELQGCYKRGEIKHKPRLPNYRKKDGLAIVSYPTQKLKTVPEGVYIPGTYLEIPLGNVFNKKYKQKNFLIPTPTNINFDEIVEVRIVPRNKCFYLEYVRLQKPSIVKDLDPTRVLGIDHGVNNWLTCVSNFGTSFIVDGLHLKTMNQLYNKRVSNLKTGKPQGFWNDTLSHITEKRNRQMRDGINKAARFVINHCIKNKIGVLVFGWNKGQKDKSNMSKKNNQKFVQIPTGRLKDRIQELCSVYGIQFIETEESYTSKTSYLDNEILPKFGEKPKDWKQSGTRSKRGLFTTANKIRINADCNGAANILRKVSKSLGLDLNGITKFCLTSPIKFYLFVEQYRFDDKFRKFNH